MSSSARSLPPSTLRSCRHATGATPPAWRPPPAAGFRARAHAGRGRHGQRGRERDPRPDGPGARAPARRRAAPRSPPCPAATPTCSPAPWACPPTRWTPPGRSSRRSPGGAPHHRPRAGGRPVFHLQRGPGPRRRGGPGGRGPPRARPGGHLGAVRVDDLRQFYRVTDRRHPALTLERDGHPPAGRCSSASCPTPRPGPTSAAARSTPARRPPSTPALTCSRCAAWGR